MVDTLMEQVAPATYGSVRALRRATDEFLHERAEDQVRHVVVLVVSELCTNAVEALDDDARAQVTLRLRDLDGCVQIEVVDAGPGFASALGRRGASTADPRGRGLQVVQSLVHNFSVHRQNGQTEVSCTVCRKTA